MTIQCHVFEINYLKCSRLHVFTVYIVSVYSVCFPMEVYLSSMYHDINYILLKCSYGSINDKLNT